MVSPTYEYLCSGCRFGWDVIKRIADIDEFERCPKCEQRGDRQISRFNFTGAADWNNQTFHPALGCYTRSNHHARQIARSRGLEEVGTEKPESIHSHFDKQREERSTERWKKAEAEQWRDSD